MSQKHVLLVQKYWFQGLSFFNPSSTWPSWLKSRGEGRYRAKWPSLSMSTCKMTQKTLSQDMYVTFIFNWSFAIWHWRWFYKEWSSYTWRVGCLIFPFFQLIHFSEVSAVIPTRFFMLNNVVRKNNVCVMPEAKLALKIWDIAFLA